MNSIPNNGSWFCGAITSCRFRQDSPLADFLAFRHCSPGPLRWPGPDGDGAGVVPRCLRSVPGTQVTSGESQYLLNCGAACNCIHWARVRDSRISNVIAELTLSISPRA